MTDIATKTYECEHFTHWSFRHYRVTTYPKSALLRIVLADKTSKRVRGWRLEADARAAIDAVRNVKAP